MRLINKTKMRMPRKWLQKLLDHLGVNPEIVIEYADNPENKKTVNYRHNGDSVDGVALDNNRVFIYVGHWENGEFTQWTQKTLLWILAHELRHQFYYYRFGNRYDHWKGFSKKERLKREERACNRFANRIVGVLKCNSDMFR